MCALTLKRSASIARNIAVRSSFVACGNNDVAITSYRSLLVQSGMPTKSAGIVGGYARATSNVTGIFVALTPPSGRLIQSEFQEPVTFRLIETTSNRGSDVPVFVVSAYADAANASVRAALRATCINKPPSSARHGPAQSGRGCTISAKSPLIRSISNSSQEHLSSGDVNRQVVRHFLHAHVRHFGI